MAAPTILRTAVGSMATRGMLQALQNYGFEVIGADMDPVSYGFSMVETAYTIPPGDDPEFIPQIHDIVDTHDVDAILAGPEVELLALSKHRDEFKNKGCTILCPPHESVKICADKNKTDQLFRELDVPTPATYNGTDNEYPCIVKPQSGEGGENVHLAHSQSEWEIYTNRMENPITQQYIDGPEFTVDIFCGKEGNPLSIIPRRRLNVKSGKSVTGITEYDKDIIEHCRKIAKKLELVGPSCIQCIRNQDGPHFLEINPRFGGGAILSVKADDSLLDNVNKLSHDLPGIESNGFREGLVMLRNYTEEFTTMEEIKDHVE